MPGLDFILRLHPVTYHYDLQAFESFMHQHDRGQSSETRMAGDSLDAVAMEARTQKESMVYTGFLAQEVAQAASDINYDFSGVRKPQNDGDYYTLAYSEFVVPLVKAVQEQQKMIDALQAEVAQLKAAR